jgi:hypothetical protein
MDALQLFQYESLRKIRKLGMSVIHVLVVDDFAPWHDFVLRFFDSESISKSVQSQSMDWMRFRKPKNYSLT